MTTPTNTYRILKISDPRSRGACYWFEIEGMNAAGERWHVATVDTRAEARQMVASIEADDARRAAEALTLAPMEECPEWIDDADPDALTLEACSPELATIDVADNLDRRRRTAAVRLASARAVADTLRHRRDDHAGRLAAARELAAAVAEYDAAWNDDADILN